jgi:alpha/beta superfamily hydrolase
MKKERTDHFIIDGNDGLLELEIDWPQEISLADTTVIISHPHPLYQGTMNNKVITTISKAFRSLGLTVVRYNYRGVGNSEGDYGNGEGEVDDLVSVAKWVRQQKKNQSLILAGFSFGGSVAYKGAARLDGVSHLLTIAPAVTRFPLDEIIEPEMPWCIIQGDDDEVVDPTCVFKWLMNDIKKPFSLLKMSDTGHFFHGRLIDLKNEILMHYKSRIL